MSTVKGQPVISIIIPTLNESVHITQTLKNLEGASRCEIVVVDGGSVDDTPSLARSWGAEVLVSPGGRAVQMNAGADVARGSILLFLHADTLLPSGFVDAVLDALVRPGIVAGAFRLRFDVVTSSRPYKRKGTWRRTLNNKVAFLSYHLGVPPQRVLRWYER